MKALDLIAKIIIGALAVSCFLVGAWVHLMVLDKILSRRDTPTVVSEAQDTIVEALGCVGDPCVIDFNPGGNAITFSRAAHLVRAGAIKQVIINGYCASGCAYFADKARPHVCITRKAVLGYHKGRSGEGEEEYLFDLIHSDDIQNWVMTQGGYPKNGMLAMKYNNAKKFWPTCPEQH